MPAASRGRPRPRPGTRSTMPTASSSRMAPSINGIASRLQRNSSALVTGRGGLVNRKQASPLAARLRPGSAVRTHNAGSWNGATFRGIGSPALLTWQGTNRLSFFRPVGRSLEHACRIFCMDAAVNGQHQQQCPPNYGEACRGRRLTARAMTAV